MNRVKAEKRFKYQKQRTCNGEEDTWKVFDQLEKEKVECQRVQGELCCVEQELDNLRVERAVDKLELYELRNTNSVLDNKLKASTSNEQFLDQNKSKITELLSKVVSLERQCDQLKQEKLTEMLLKNEALKSKSRKRKNNNNRAILEVVKKKNQQNKEAAEKIGEYSKEIERLRFKDRANSNKLALYESKVDKYEKELDIANREIQKFLTTLQGKLGYRRFRGSVSRSFFYLFLCC